MKIDSSDVVNIESKLKMNDNRAASVFSERESAGSPATSILFNARKSVENNESFFFLLTFSSCFFKEEKVRIVLFFLFCCDKKIFYFTSKLVSVSTS